MAIAGEYIAARILERASKLSVEFMTAASIPVSVSQENSNYIPHVRCVWNRDMTSAGRPEIASGYIPIIPRLQSMFRDSRNAQMLLYRLQSEVDPDRSEDVWGSMILQELLNTNVAIEGQAQEYH